MVTPPAAEMKEGPNEKKKGRGRRWKKKARTRPHPSTRSDEMSGLRRASLQQHKFADQSAVPLEKKRLRKSSTIERGIRVRDLKEARC